MKVQAMPRSRLGELFSDINSNNIRYSRHFAPRVILV
jgi:hypothetical protein